LGEPDVAQLVQVNFDSPEGVGAAADVLEALVDEATLLLAV